MDAGNPTPDDRENVSDERIDESRRRFLGAAAALSAFTAGADTITDDVDDDVLEERDDFEEIDDETEYGSSTIVNTSGGLELLTGYNYNTEVKVSSKHDGIELQLANRIGLK